MKIIEMISERIEEEIEDSGFYADWAAKYKEEYPTLAKTAYEISVDEGKHVQLLHAEVTKMIREYREKHGEPPAEMKAVYDYLHKKQIDKLAMVKQKQSMYTG